MKTHHILIVVFLFNSLISFSQTKPAAKPTTQREIDRLAAKYKNTEEITIYLTHTELTGSVGIEYNSDNKPLAITISVSSQGIEPLAEFVMNMINQKQSQGYKSTEGWLHTTDGIRNDLEKEKQNYSFKKGNMLFNLYMHRTPDLVYSDKIIFDQIQNPNSPSFSEMKKNQIITHYVTIETMDYSRKGGTKATKLDF